jgi:hypothetical protein
VVLRYAVIILVRCARSTPTILSVVIVTTSAVAPFAVEVILGTAIADAMIAVVSSIVLIAIAIGTAIGT